MSLTVIHLSKQYGQAPIFQNISFHADAGAFAITGAPGSGKSTLFRMLAGLEAPDSGRVLLDGQNLYTTPGLAKRQVGLLPQQPALDGDATAADVLHLCAQLSGEKDRLRRIYQVEQLLHQLGLEGEAKQKTAVFTQGMKKRLYLAACLIKRPRVLLLDAPDQALNGYERQLVSAVLAQQAASIPVLCALQNPAVFSLPVLAAL